MDGGLCRLHPNPRIFFRDLERSVGAKMDTVEAKQVCNGTPTRPPCPVRDDCLEYALAGGMIFVWAGTTTKEREKIVRLRKRQSLAATG